MKDPRDYLVHMTAPSSGFSFGRLKDDPGDETGSGITVLTHNDFLYAFLSTIVSHRTGGVSEEDEKESASDFRDAIEELCGFRVDGVNAWSPATTYSTLGTAVLRHGMQFVNINNSGNTNKPPETNPTYWYPCPKADAAISLYHGARLISGELSPLHVHGGAQYQTIFSLGRHRIGNALTGAFYNAYGIHLDGSTVVPSSLLDTVVAAHWAKDIFAPLDTGVRYLKDVRECVIRSMGASGGNAPTLAEVQEDMVKNHTHLGTGVGIIDLFYTPLGIAGGANQGKSITVGTGNVSKYLTTATAGNVPGEPPETRGKSFVTGVPYVVGLVAE